MTETRPHVTADESELPVVSGDPAAVLGFAFGFLGLVAILVIRLCA